MRPSSRNATCTPLAPSQRGTKNQAVGGGIIRKRDQYLRVEAEKKAGRGKEVGNGKWGGGARKNDLAPMVGGGGLIRNLFNFLPEKESKTLKGWATCSRAVLSDHSPPSPISFLGRGETHYFIPWWGFSLPPESVGVEVGVDPTHRRKCQYDIIRPHSLSNPNPLARG